MDVDKPAGITKYFKKEPAPPPPKREPSPPHEYVLADNPNIAVSSCDIRSINVPWLCCLLTCCDAKFVVMFRSRFHEVFPRSTPHFGPQDVERGAVEQPPGNHIERLLCAFLGLVLNRKKEVEYGRHPSPAPRDAFSEGSLGFR